MTRREGHRAAHRLLVDATRHAHRLGAGIAVHALTEMRSRTLAEWHNHHRELADEQDDRA